MDPDKIQRRDTLFALRKARRKYVCTNIHSMDKHALFVRGMFPGKRSCWGEKTSRQLKLFFPRHFSACCFAVIFIAPA